MSVPITCPHCGDVSQQDYLLPKFTCGACDQPFYTVLFPPVAKTVKPTETWVIVDEMPPRMRLRAMTPTDLREILDYLSLSQRNLATLLHRREGDVRAWARGAQPIPDDVADGLEQIAAIVARLQIRQAQKEG